MWHKVREQMLLNAATSRDKGEMKRREKKVLGASAKEEDGMHRWSLLSSANTLETHPVLQHFTYLSHNK